MILGGKEAVTGCQASGLSVTCALGPRERDCGPVAARTSCSQCQKTLHLGSCLDSDILGLDGSLRTHSPHGMIWDRCLLTGLCCNDLPAGFKPSKGSPSCGVISILHDRDYRLEVAEGLWEGHPSPQTRSTGLLP